MGRYKKFPSDPNQRKPWTLWERQRAWTMYIDGRSYKHISKVIGKSEDAVSSEIWKECVQYNVTKERKLVEYDGSRVGHEWTMREVEVMEKVLPENPTDRDFEFLAGLLGRDSLQVKHKHKKRKPTTLEDLVLKEAPQTPGPGIVVGYNFEECSQAEDDPVRHPLWLDFVEWAQENSNGPLNNHPDDWMPDWKCFTAGATAQSNHQKEAYAKSFE